MLGSKMGAAAVKRKDGEEGFETAKAARGTRRVIDGVDVLQLDLGTAGLTVELERRVRDIEGAVYNRFRLPANAAWAVLAQERKRGQASRVKWGDKSPGSPQAWAMSGI